MRRKSLYTETEGYSLEAQALDNATEAAIKGIFAEYVEKGYSCRDIASIIHLCITGIESETILNLRLKKTGSYA